MTEPKKKTRLLKAACANLLLIGGVAVLVYGGLSVLSSRLVKLVAPNQLARSAGGNFATTDSYLSALELLNPSEQVLAAVKQLPEDDAMIFIGPDAQPQTELVYRTIAYLSWPRQIGALYCGAKDEPLTLLFKPREGKHVRWLLFYRRQIPADVSTLPGSIELGAHLTLVPLQETKEWTFYCSQ